MGARSLVHNPCITRFGLERFEVPGTERGLPMRPLSQGETLTPRRMARLRVVRGRATVEVSGLELLQPTEAVDRTTPRAPSDVRITQDTPQVRAGWLSLAAIAVLAVPAAWATAADTCSEAAWLVPVLASTSLAALAVLVFGFRRGHPVLGVFGALVGGVLWLTVAFILAFLVWFPFVPERCTYDFGL